MRLLKALIDLDKNDARVQGRCKYRASDIAAVALCAIAADAKSCYDIEAFGKEKLPELRNFLALENGIPSHDTFQRYIRDNCPKLLNFIFAMWTSILWKEYNGDTIHVDGKSLRRAAGQSGKQPCIVSAYSSRKQIVISQTKAEEKSNEITAIPVLLESMDLEGVTVTVDAAGCQIKNASIISRKKG